MKGASLTSRTAGWEPGAPGADTNRKDAPRATEGLATGFLRRWGAAGQWAAWGSWETSSTHSRSFSHTSSCPSEPGGFHCGDSQTQQHLTSRGKGRGKKLKMSTGIRWMCPPRDEASPFFPASRCLPSSPCLSSLGQEGNEHFSFWRNWAICEERPVDPGIWGPCWIPGGLLPSSKPQPTRQFPVTDHETFKENLKHRIQGKWIQKRKQERKKLERIEKMPKIVGDS